MIHCTHQKVIQSRNKITHSSHIKRAVITATGNSFPSYSE
ncbi:hypothetical protein ASZ90_016844 [hydrocarbon metagenome]|uniref:Uncharacterized protein n=1 Tax=hydrocarbon metagenome TaxID=938273 RepID=A0A0W8EAT0_9ZZZZ